MENHVFIDELHNEPCDNLEDITKVIDFDKLLSMFNTSGMKMAQLAQATGVPEGTLYKFFKGARKNPSLRNVVSIVKALGGSMDELVGIRTKEEDSLAVPVYLQMLEQERNNSKMALEQERENNRLVMEQERENNRITMEQAQLTADQTLEAVKAVLRKSETSRKLMTIMVIVLTAIVFALIVMMFLMLH